MSDAQEGPGWWQATDGKWYPPESHPSQQAPPPPAAYQVTPGYPPHPGYTPPSGYTPPPGYSAPPGYPAAPGAGAPPGQAGPPGYATAPTAYPQWGPGYPAYGAVSPARQTNGLAVASLVCSVAGIFFGITSVVGIVLGFVALSQIKKSGGAQGGHGLALAGVIVGFSLIALIILFLVVAGVSSNN